ncbi:MAG: GPR endopeptidase [Lachnospiraceae bacterium]|nr:GPR endopeptidase [Lachnospiraceae bacterium]
MMSGEEPGYGMREVFGHGMGDAAGAVSGVDDFGGGSGAADDLAGDAVLRELWAGLRSDLLLEAAVLPGGGPDGGGRGAGGNGLGGDDLFVRESERNGLEITEIRVETEAQERRLGRKRGRYVTIYSEGLKADDGGIHREAVDEVAGWLRKLLPDGVKTVFVAGLGNSEASPDALGPDTVSHVAVNRHLQGHQGEEEDTSGIQICAMSPGVMAQTGLETAGILAGVTGEFKPDALVVVDALAARSVTRLGTTIQLTDTGISPGSGIGNYRQEISREVIGIPVVAVGIPMVVEAAAIVYETVEAVRSALRQEHMDGEAGFLKQLSSREQHELFRELLEKKARPLYVTVKDVDELEKRLSFTLSEAINQAFSGMNRTPRA